MTGMGGGRTQHDRSDATNPADSADSPAGLVDGRPGDNARDAGEDDTTVLTTAPEAQHEDSVVDPGTQSG